MGQKLYALTREGHQLIRRLQQGDEPAPTGVAATIKLSRDQEKFILGLFASSAVQKYEESRKGELTFADATRFVQQSTIWDAPQSADFATAAVVTYCPQFESTNTDQMQQVLQKSATNLQTIEGDLQSINHDLQGISDGLHGGY